MPAITPGVKRRFAEAMVGTGMIAAAMLSSGVARAGASRSDAVDVDGLECRLAFESTRESEFTDGVKPDYLYLLLQAPRVNPSAIDSVLQFVPDQAEPEYMIDPVLGKSSVDADALRFVTSRDAVEEPFSLRIERQPPRLWTWQNRIPNYVVGDYVSSIFKTQPKWVELEGNIAGSAAGPTPETKIDGAQSYAMVFACRHVDPKKLRDASREHYRRTH